MEKSYQRLRLIMPLCARRERLTRKEMTPKQVGNLVFYHKDYYKIYRRLDKYVKILIKCVEKGEIGVGRYFYNLPDLKVHPIIPNAWLEVYDLFPNMRNLISPDEKTDCTKDKIGLRFFSKFCFKDERDRRIKTGLEFLDPTDSYNPSDYFYYVPEWGIGSWRRVRKNKIDFKLKDYKEII